MMEIERLKALRDTERVEREKVVAQRQGAAVIIEQIKEREAERLRQQEQREREMQALARQLEI